MIESSSNRRHVLLQIDKTTGLYKDNYIYKIGSAAADGLGKGSGVASYNTYRSQSFVIDKTGSTFNALYYAFIESSTPTTQDVLHYMSTPELFTPPTYQLHITVTGIT
jgi:hypothetical protein